MTDDAVSPETTQASAFEVFRVFLRLGLTSFGGPVAHLGYFRTEFVERRRWLDDQAYADLVALCQFLPGPASSQVGIAVGVLRAGWRGALAAWLGFTMPSAVLLVAFALFVRGTGVGDDASWLHGLKVVAVAVVAQAIWGMSRTLCPDWPRRGVALAAAAVAFALPGPATQAAVIAMAGAIGVASMRAGDALPGRPFPLRFGPRTGVALLVLHGVLLVLLPLLAGLADNAALRVVDVFYRAGALVFGGGHVVLPLLQTQTVAPGWVSNDVFLAGYGAAQAVPGPLFTFAAYLGAVSVPEPSGIYGATLALVAIFLPAFLLVLGALPLWNLLRHHPRMQRALLGINAAVVGVLLAAFVDPVWVTAIHSIADVALAAAAFVLLVAARLPPWSVVIGCAAVAAFL
jgi:chromate transporter